MGAKLVDLVLGGEGLIGAELVAILRHRGSCVVSLDLKTTGDLRDTDPAPFHKCDRVWFLAWDTGGAKYIRNPFHQHDMYKHNCELSAKVFDLLCKTRKPFVFATSQLAGQPNAYGLTKLLAEHWAEQIGGKVARLWNTYGWEEPGLKSHVITDFVLSAIREKVVRCNTNGRERRRFIYKTDCAQAMVSLFESDHISADIAGPEWVTVERVATEIAVKLSAETCFTESQGDELLIEPVNLLPQWEPTMSLSDGLDRVIDDAKRYLVFNEEW